MGRCVNHKVFQGIITMAGYIYIYIYIDHSSVHNIHYNYDVCYIQEMV